MRRPRVALFDRTSAEPQPSSWSQLRAAARERGWRVTMEVRQADARRILAAAGRREIDAVMVTRLHRFAAATVAELVASLRELQACGVRFVAVEQGLELGDDASQQQLALLEAVAEFEHERGRERTLRGLARRKREGLHVGRQPVKRPPVDRVRKLRRAGKTWEEIAAALECSVWAARTVLKPELLQRKSAKPD